MDDHHPPSLLPLSSEEPELDFGLSANHDELQDQQEEDEEDEEWADGAPGDSNNHNHDAAVARSPMKGDEDEDEEAWAGRVMERVDVSACKQWHDARDEHDFVVRGESYLRDRVKVQAGSALCRLLSFDLFTVPDGVSRVDNIAAVGACARRVRQLREVLRQEELTAGGTGKPAPLFVLALQLPGTPLVYGVLCWAVPPSASGGVGGEGLHGPALALLARYCEIPLEESPKLVPAKPSSGMLRSMISSPKVSPKRTEGKGANGECFDSLESERSTSSFHANRFKVIPRVVQGPWVVKKGVGAVPCLLGQKVTMRVWRGDGYCETNVEVASSTVARKVMANCRGCSTKIDVQMAVVLQGEHEEELPESLLGVVRFSWLRIDDSECRVPLTP
jgi:hypothetical protein